MTVAQLASKLFLLAEEGYGEYDVYTEAYCPKNDYTHCNFPNAVQRDTLLDKNVVVIR